MFGSNSASLSSRRYVRAPRRCTASSARRIRVARTYASSRSAPWSRRPHRSNVAAT